jgi:mono/diheme cytochrome c family protein
MPPRRAVLAALGIVAVAALLFGKRAFETWSWWREGNAVRRGRQVAAGAGCFSCHGPGGIRGVKNPGSRWGDVPAWDGGSWMMYVSAPAEIEEYIRYGLPRRKQQDSGARAQAEKALIRMPAYEGRLSERAIRDLTLFVQAVSGLGRPPDGPAAQGYDLVMEYGCFACHGVEGTGGIRNPGSFKGYVPGWRGPDWRELVESDDEIREWITEGGIRRWSGNRLAMRYTASQAIQMPAYREALAPAQVEAIVAYIKWLRAHPAP